MENMNRMLEEAMSNGYAIPQFNIMNLEWTRFILEAAEENKKPVILGVSEGAIKYMGGFNVVYSLVVSLMHDLNITIPVCLHLDHGSSVAVCKQAIDAGFTSVMIDASKYDLDKNIEITKEVVDYGHKFGVSIEAEVGHIGGTEDNVSADIAYAKVDDCISLVKKTNVDALAPALGSVHGIYTGEPNLQFDTMKEIMEKTNKPLVLHGGSGIDDEKLVKAINSGICKLNINTELQMAWHEAVLKFINENENAYDPRKIIKAGEMAIKKAIEDKYNVLKTM